MKPLAMLLSAFISLSAFADPVTRFCTVDDPTRSTALPAETIVIQATDDFFNGSALGGSVTSIDYMHVNADANGQMTSSTEHLFGRDDNQAIVFAGLTTQYCSAYDNRYDAAGVGDAAVDANCQYPAGSLSLSFLVEKEHEGAFNFVAFPSDFSQTIQRKFNILPCQ